MKINNSKQFIQPNRTAKTMMEKKDNDLTVTDEVILSSSLPVDKEKTILELNSSPGTNYGQAFESVLNLLDQAVVKTKETGGELNKTAKEVYDARKKLYDSRNYITLAKTDSEYNNVSYAGHNLNNTMIYAGQDLSDGNNYIDNAAAGIDNTEKFLSQAGEKLGVLEKELEAGGLYGEAVKLVGAAKKYIDASLADSGKVDNNIGNTDKDIYYGRKELNNTIPWINNIMNDRPGENVSLSGIQTEMYVNRAERYLKEADSQLASSGEGYSSLSSDIASAIKAVKDAYAITQKTGLQTSDS